MNLTFNRTDKIAGINTIYAPPGLRPGRYRIVSVVSAIAAGHDLVVAYIIRHRGRLVRCWLH